MIWYTNAFAWSGTSHYGKTESHRYFTGYTVGCTTSNRVIWEDRRQELDHQPLSLYHQFDLNFIAKGVPLTKSVRMHVNAYGGGRIYKHGN